MKRLAMCVAAFGVVAGAHAFVNLNIDLQYQTVARPSSGSISVVFTGTVDVLMSNVDVTGATLEFPFAAGNGTPLSATFDPTFVAYVLSSAAGVDYTGNLFSVDVTSTTPNGLYILDITNNLSEFIVAASNGTVTDADNEFYGVEVVPEPATLAVLGIGALGLMRRRRASK